MSLHKVVVVVLLLISLVTIHIQSALGAGRGLETKEKCGKKIERNLKSVYEIGKQIKATERTFMLPPTSVFLDVLSSFFLSAAWVRMGVRDVHQQKQAQGTLDAVVFSMAAVERVEESFLTASALRSVAT
jgi:hypothetical protein